VSAPRTRCDRDLQGSRVTGLLPGRLCGYSASAYHETGPAGRRNGRGVSHRLRGSIGTAGQPPQWTETAVDPRLISHAHTGSARLSQNGRKANDARVSSSRSTTVRLVDPPARARFGLLPDRYTGLYPR